MSGYRRWCARRLDEHDLVYLFPDAIYLKLHPDDTPADGCRRLGPDPGRPKGLLGLQLGAAKATKTDWLSARPDRGRDKRARPSTRAACSAPGYPSRAASLAGSDRLDRGSKRPQRTFERLLGASLDHPLHDHDWCAEALSRLALLSPRGATSGGRTHRRSLSWLVLRPQSGQVTASPKRARISFPGQGHPQALANARVSEDTRRLNVDDPRR